MVKNKKRSVSLIIIASIWIILNVALVVIGILNFQSFDWLTSTLLIIAGLISIIFATIALVKNDPAWLLLDIIFPS